METKDYALVLQVNSAKTVDVAYLGRRLADKSEYKLVHERYRQAGDPSGMFDNAYTSSGSRNLLEPAISVSHADGNQSLDLLYVSHESKVESEGVTLYSIRLKDPVYPFETTLYYRVFYAENVLEQWSSIKHQEKGNVTLHKYASASLSLKGNQYYLRHYHGNWAQEMKPEEELITHGIKTLDSKLGTRANLFMPSMFMLSMGSPSREDEGEILMGSLAWSGNFKIDFELDPQQNLRLIAGVNNYASAYALPADSLFTTPALIYTLSKDGKGGASRQLHRWARKHRLQDGQGERLTLLNNWEATYFDFDEEKIKGILADTKKLGVDLFLLDDGWFANKYPRNSDNAGLGDWDVNKKKLPNGLASIIREAQQNQVKFGIWLEPEMVNPKSELYEKHPDWVVKQPERPEYYFRNQLILDLSNPEVQQFVFGIVDGLLTENPDLAYIKWDCNAVIYNMYSAHLDNQSRFYVDYVHGLYKVLDRIRQKYPAIPMMLCAGGGGRVDYGALRYFNEFWPSDNTDPLERIYMQYEYSYFFPAKAMAAHVTNWGNQSLKFKLDVAMMGKLGFDIVVEHLSPRDLGFAQEAVRQYNMFKDLVWQGDQYRLADPQQGHVASVQYLNETKKRAIVFSYLLDYRYGSSTQVPIKMKGLQADTRYRIKEMNLYPDAEGKVKSPIKEEIFSGEFLMTVGFNPQLSNARRSVVLAVESID